MSDSLSRQHEQRWCRIHGAAGHRHVQSCPLCMTALEHSRCPNCKADFITPGFYGAAWRCIELTQALER